MAATKAHTDKINSWFEIRRQPLLVAGPCSAESEDQLLRTARELANSGTVSAIRAGLWKPRTRPDSFEGIGHVGLNWLQSVQMETGLPVATEVANARHVEACLKAGIDILWIGARTTVNPFYVQEIADALRGTDIPVFVKNPIHPDLGLWLGALERLDQAGINKLVAVHRGFYADQSAPYRNEPKWEMSFALRVKAPDVPIICDPSHIAGRRNLIEQVAQTALDIDLDGLMIESHYNPDIALSDAPQQLTPTDLIALMDRLVVRSAHAGGARTHEQLDQLRTKIDGLDEQIVELLSQRMGLVDKIGAVKAEHDISIFQMERWFEVLSKRGIQANDVELNSGFIQELFQVIHKYSVERQTGVFQRLDKDIPKS